MKKTDDMSLLELIDRWQASSVLAIDGADEDTDRAREARHDLELRLSRLEGLAVGLSHGPLMRALQGVTPEEIKYREDADRTAANLTNQGIRGNSWVQ